MSARHVLPRPCTMNCQEPTWNCFPSSARVAIEVTDFHFPVCFLREFFAFSIFSRGCESPQSGTRVFDFTFASCRAHCTGVECYYSVVNIKSEQCRRVTGCVCVACAAVRPLEALISQCCRTSGWQRLPHAAGLRTHSACGGTCPVPATPWPAALQWKSTILQSSWPGRRLVRCSRLSFTICTPGPPAQAHTALTFAAAHAPGRRPGRTASGRRTPPPPASASRVPRR